MAKFAVIRIKGQQYKVSEGDEILVDRLGGEKPEAEVLLLANGKTKVGTPTVKGAKVKLKVLEEEVKGEKIFVETFKAKARQRKKKGYRHTFTRLKVEKITS